MIYQWAVIGAGPAGIAAVGKLIDAGIPAGKIVWVDPKFTVGDFGTLWRDLPSNSKVGSFLKFLYACAAFDYQKCPEDFAINHLDPQQTCYLRLIADPLQWITNHLKRTTNAIQDVAHALSLSNRVWNIELKNSIIHAHNVILAIGAVPRSLNYADLPIVPLQDAMDSIRIHDHLKHDDVVAVFGSSHSAILTIRNLVENNVGQIINFFRSPLRYAIYLKDWILFHDTGLKGSTAEWARAHIDGQLPQNLIRVYANEENINQHLPQCKKVIYAVGFERRSLPIIKNMGHITYIEQCGIIAPGLFGLGIAFPQAKSDRIGLVEYRVGLWKFMDYLQDMIPIWLQYPA